MRSNDLANIVGVSVKTLRHYHKIKLLPEPKRDTNNYRIYDTQHLARLLRIRRMSAIGLALDDIGKILSGDDSESDSLLTVLDVDLKKQVDRLNRQRTLIEKLRTSRTTPDVPLELAPYYALFVSMSERAREVLREQLVLLEFVVGDEGMPLLISYFDRLTAPGLRATTIDITQRFYQLDPKSDDEVIDQLIKDHVAVYGEVTVEFDGLLERPQLNRRMKLMFEHIIVSMSPHQRTVFLGIVQELDKLRRGARRLNAS